MALTTTLESLSTRVAAILGSRGLKAGGATGDVLRKTAATSYATAWASDTAAASAGLSSVVNSTASGTLAWAWTKDRNFLELKLTGNAVLSAPTFTGLPAGKIGYLMVSGAFALTLNTAFRAGNAADLTYSGSPVIYTFVADGAGKVNLLKVTGSNPYNDALWINTIFLLKNNGVNNATNSLFVDASANAVSFTRTGSVTAAASTEFAGLTTVGSFTGGYLASATHPALALQNANNTNSFTLEGRFKLNTGVGGNTWVLSGGGMGLFCPGANASALLRLYPSTGGTSDLFYITLPIGTAFHVAIVKEGTTYKAYINGVLAGTAVNGSTVYYPTNSNVGLMGGSGLGIWHGNAADIRLSNIARYTANFTPPTAAFVPDANTSLLMGTNSNLAIFDGTAKRTIQTEGAAKVSTTQTLFGEATALFSGTGGDCLVMPASTDWNVGSGDFTVEFSANRLGAGQDAGGGNRLFQTAPADSNALTINDIAGNIGLHASSNGSALDVIHNINVVAMGTGWHHYALVRSGNTFTFYRDNVVVLTFTSAAALYYNNTQVVIGGQPGGRAFNGAIANFRFTKGAARTISLPTAPFMVE